MNPVPVPFRMKVPDREEIGIDGIESVSYKLDGLIHLEGGVVTLEWTGTELTEQVSWSKVGTDVEHLPTEFVELPAAWVIDVRVLGGWWRPRLELRIRWVDALAAVPSSRGGTIALHLRWRDRDLARAMAAAIELARAEAALLDSASGPALGTPSDPGLGDDRA